MVSRHLLCPVWKLSYDFQYKHPVRFFMVSLHLLWAHLATFFQIPMALVAGGLAVSLPAVLLYVSDVLHN